MNNRHADVEHRRAELQAGGGQEKLARQHAAHKLSARERLAHLFSAHSFVEVGLWAKHRCRELDDKSFPADGVVAGQGIVDGRPVVAFSQDFTVGGGAVGEMHAAKIVECLETALKCGVPVVGFNDGGGARIQEGVAALSGYGKIFYHNTLLSGVVPQIAVIAGPCAGGAAYSPALNDFVIMVQGTAHMFIAGPGVIRAATGEDISEDALGGATAHAQIAGNIHLIARDEREAIALVKQLLSYLPQNNLESPRDLAFGSAVADIPELERAVPDDPRKAYDVKQVIAHMVDAGSFFELQRDFAPNIVTGFARLAGMAVGVVANQPAVLSGVLDINASDKAARFVRTCNVYNIPIVTLVDVPGFLPGVAQEHGGIIRHGAKMLFAYSAATVPKLTVIMRKAYGGAYLAMCSRDLGADAVFAWPSAEIAVMGPEGAARVLYKRELDKAEDRAELLHQKIDAYRAQHANPYRAAEALHVDDVINPASTRRLLCQRLLLLRTKRDLRPQKKHGNIPL